MHLPIPSLGNAEIRSTGIYDHVNDRLIGPAIIRAMRGTIEIAKQSRLNSIAPYDDIVGYLTGYECIYNANGAGGFCDYNNRVIAISKNQRNVLATVCHEVSHAIQADLGIFAKQQMVLSCQVKIEQQCETMAFYLYNSLFPEVPAPWWMFDSYFKHRDIAFLKDWYKGWIQDDLATETLKL